MVAGESFLPHPEANQHPEIVDFDAAGDPGFDVHLPWPVEYLAGGGSIASGRNATLYATPKHAGTQNPGGPLPTVQVPGRSM